TGRILFQDGDGKFGTALTIAGEESFGIGNGRNRSAGGKNAGGGLLVFVREFGDFGDGGGAVLRGGAGRAREITRDPGIRLRSRHRQQIGIFGLAPRQRGRSGDGATQRIVIDFVCAGAGGAPV